MRRTVYFTLVSVLTIVLVLAGCQSVKNIFRGKTKTIVIYTSMYEDVLESMAKTLKKEFPHCQIQFVHGGTGILQEKINIEQVSGKLGCDILMVAEPAYSLELKEKNMLHPFKSKETANLAFDYDPEGYWYPVRVSNMVLAYNPARNAKNTVPNSFYDFAYDAKVRGAISMRNPLVSGTTMAAAAALRDKYGHAYFEALGKQHVIIDYGADDTLAKLESGECKVAMILEESILKIKQEKNSRLEVIYPTDGTVVIPSAIMIINNRWSANRNTQAAEAITDWFLSPEGQAAIVAGWMHSVRTDFSGLPRGSIPIEEIRANSIPIVWENVFKQKDDIRRRFEEQAIGQR